MKINVYFASNVFSPVKAARYTHMSIHSFIGKHDQSFTHTLFTSPVHRHSFCKPYILAFVINKYVIPFFFHSKDFALRLSALFIL